MKRVQKKNEVKVMNLVIHTRYGRLDIVSKSEPALCSLPVVAKYLKLPQDEVRRLYRRFFSKSKPTPNLSPVHLNYLTDSSTLKKQTTFSLLERCLEFNAKF